VPYSLVSEAVLPPSSGLKCIVKETYPVAMYCSVAILLLNL
jgi:hypothetical protein